MAVNVCEITHAIYQRGLRCDVELVPSLPKDALALTGNPSLRFGFANANP